MPSHYASFSPRGAEVRQEDEMHDQLYRIECERDRHAVRMSDHAEVDHNAQRTSSG